MTTATQNRPGFVFTGRHMLAIMLSFFGVVIAVNVLMAYYAASTWSGLVVDDTYVASQKFNGQAEAEKKRLADGMRGEVKIDGDHITFTVTRAGQPVDEADDVTLIFKRPVGTHQDFTVKLNGAGQGIYTIDHPVAAGAWIVEGSVTHKGELIIHEANRIIVKG